jgi:hypothetical protein
MLRRRTLAFTACAAAVMALAKAARADVVIRTRDGAVHRVPVNPQDITSIEMVPGAGAPGAPPVVAPPGPAGGVQVGLPWVVNNGANIYRGDGRSWQQLPGAGQDIGVGADGSVWVIGTNSAPGGFGIWRWTGSNWVQVDGGAVRVSVDGRGEPWVVNSEGRIFHRRANAWRELPGRAIDIGAGANGEVWVVGTDSAAGGSSIFRWNGSQWDKVDGAAVRIAVGPDGNPWVVNSEGRIYRRQASGWTELPGRAKDIAVSSNGTAWVIGTDAVPGGSSVFYWNGSTWVRIDGGAVGIASR